jgi:hypothetical protein
MSDNPLIIKRNPRNPLRRADADAPQVDETIPEREPLLTMPKPNPPAVDPAPFDLDVVIAPPVKPKLSEPTPALTEAQKQEIEEREMMNRASKLQEAAKARKVLAAAGISEADIENAQKINTYIYYERHDRNGNDISTLTPQFDNFLPRGDGYYLYQEPKDNPVTDETLQMHLANCRMRINTVKISDKPATYEFDNLGGIRKNNPINESRMSLASSDPI